MRCPKGLLFKLLTVVALCFGVPITHAAPPDVLGYTGGKRITVVDRGANFYPGTNQIYAFLGIPASRHGVTAYPASNGVVGGVVAHGERCFGNLLSNIVYDSSTNLPGQTFPADSILDIAILAPGGRPLIVFVAVGNSNQFFGSYVYDCRTGALTTIQESGGAIPPIPGVVDPIAFGANSVSANDRGIGQTWSYSSASGNGSVALFYDLTDLGSSAAKLGDEGTVITYQGEGGIFPTLPGRVVGPLGNFEVNNRMAMMTDFPDNSFGLFKQPLDPETGPDGFMLFERGQTVPGTNIIADGLGRMGISDCGCAVGVFDSESINHLVAHVGSPMIGPGTATFDVIQKVLDTIDGEDILGIGSPIIDCPNRIFFELGTIQNSSYVQIGRAVPIPGDPNGWQSSLFAGSNTDLPGNPEPLNSHILANVENDDVTALKFSSIGEPFVAHARAGFHDREIFTDGFEAGNTSSWSSDFQNVGGIVRKMVPADEGVSVLEVDADGNINVQSNNPANAGLISDHSYLSPIWRADGVYTINGLSQAGNPGAGVAATRITDGVNIIQFKDVVTGDVISNIFPFSTAWTLVAIDIVPGVAPGGGSAVAVLASRNSDGLMAVQLWDAATGGFIRFIFPLGLGWIPLDLAIINNDPAGPALAVLAKRASDNLIDVQVRRISDSSVVRNVYPLGFGWTPVEMRIVGDTNNNIDDIAVRMVRNADGLEAIQVRDGSTGGFIVNHFPFGGGFDTLSMRATVVNGSPAIAVLYTQLSTGQMIAQVRDLASTTIIRNTAFLGPAFTANGFFTLNDLTGNGAGELGVHSTNSLTNAQLIQLRDGLNSQVIHNIPVSP